ncbi:MAG: hypothetical protein QM718_03170 [Steroidobacteraceae bacterium]
MISSLGGASSSALSYLQSLSGGQCAGGTDSTSASSSTGSTSFASQLFEQMDSDGDGSISSTEFTDAVNELSSSLLSQVQQSQASGGAAGAGGPGGPGMGPPPPPPDGDGSDEGFTADQLSSMASATSSSDPDASDLFAALANDFGTADTDGNGKVNRSEAMAYMDTYLSSAPSVTYSSTLTISA